MTRSEKYLAWYSGLLTAAFAVVVLTGASASRNAKFDEIDVQRINVREADGTLRMAISNNARMPQSYFKGRKYPHPNAGKRGAGMLFFNDEGTETGGLTYGAMKGPDGKIRSTVHMSFDQYDQDQTLVLQQEDRDGMHKAGLAVSDRPEESLLPLLTEYKRVSALPETEREKQWQAYLAAYRKDYHGGPRLFVGKTPDRASVLELKDAQGKTRLQLRVEKNGTAKIEFLDADGKVQRTLTPEKM